MKKPLNKTLNRTEMVRELMHELKNDLERDHARIRACRDTIKVEKECMREAEARVAEMKDQLAVLEGMLSVQYPHPRVLPAPLRDDPHMSLSSRLSSSSDEGVMRISPEQIQDTQGWFLLVEAGRLLRCPSCKISAHIRKESGGKEVHYFKGNSGLIAHIMKNHSDEAARIKDVGRGGVAAYIRKYSRPLSKKESDAFKNDLPGVYIDTYVSSDSVYTNWRRQAVSSESPTDTVRVEMRSRKRAIEQDSTRRGRTGGAFQATKTVSAPQNLSRKTLRSQVIASSTSPPENGLEDAGSMSTVRTWKRIATENDRILNLSPTPPQDYLDPMILSRNDRVNIWSTN